MSIKTLLLLFVIIHRPETRTVHVIRLLLFYRFKPPKKKCFNLTLQGLSKQTKEGLYVLKIRAKGVMSLKKILGVPSYCQIPIDPTDYPLFSGRAIRSAFSHYHCQRTIKSDVHSTGETYRINSHLTCTTFNVI